MRIVWIFGWVILAASLAFGQGRRRYSRRQGYGYRRRDGCGSYYNNE